LDIKGFSQIISHHADGFSGTSRDISGTLRAVKYSVGAIN